MHSIPDQAGGTDDSQTPRHVATLTKPDAQSAARYAAAPVLLNDDQAAACLGVSTRKFHQLRREPWMPSAVVLGPRLLRWPRAEIEAAVVAMPRQAAPGAEPACLRRQRIERAKRDGCLA